MSSLFAFVYGILPEVRVVLLNVEAVTLPVTTTLPEADKDVTPFVNEISLVVDAPPSVIVCKVEETASHDTPAAELLRNFSVGPVP